MKPRYALFFVGLALAVVAIGSATLNIISLWWLRGDTIRTSFPVSETVEVRADCGSVTVRGAEVGRARVTMHKISAFREPVLESTAQGTTRTIRAHCPWSFGTGSSADLTVTVPRETRVVVRSSGSGVDVENLAGPIDASSSADEVDGRALASRTVTARSSAGWVRLAFERAQERVSASSSAGSVTVLLPRGAEAYRVEGSSSAGSTTTEVRTDPESSRRITVRSSAGNVRVSYLD
jgi:hypothetical protein